MNWEEVWRKRSLRSARHGGREELEDGGNDSYRVEVEELQVEKWNRFALLSPASLAGVA